MMKQSILPIKLKKSDGLVTSQSGLLLIGEALKTYGIEEKLKGLRIPKSNRGRRAYEYILPIIVSFAGGGRTLEDVERLFSDKALCQTLGLRSFKASCLAKWMKRNSDLEMDIRKIADEFAADLIKKSGLKALTYDPDAMAIESDKASAEKTYKGFRGYMPLLSFIPELKLNIFQRFRTGNTSPAKGIYESFVQSRALLPQGVDFSYFRSDSAAYQAKILTNCQETDVSFTVTTTMDSAVKESISTIPEDAWRVLLDDEGNETEREVAETLHCMTDTPQAFRLIVQRARNQQMDLFSEGKQRHYAIATNFGEEKSIKAIIKWHQQRAASENDNKEVKHSLNLDYLPTGEFGANNFWFTIGLLVFNLFQALKLFALPKNWSRKKISSIRWQLIQIPGKVVYHARQLTLYLHGISQDLFDIFHRCRRNLCLS